jgi:hypothetical protein
MSPKFRTGKPIFQSAFARTRSLGPWSPAVLVDGHAPHPAGPASPVRLEWAFASRALFQRFERAGIRPRPEPANNWEARPRPGQARLPS